MQNSSPIELWWSGFAVLGCIASLLLTGWAISSLRIVASNVERGRARVWGPGWNLAFGLLVAMIFFTIAWVGYLAIGVLALSVPPPPTQAGREASNILGYILIGMEAAHACAMVALYVCFSSLTRVKIPSLHPASMEGK